MRSSALRILVTALVIVVLGASVLCLADDYLVIKRKGGPTQKIPLDFPPDQIESFQVEPSPPGAGPSPADRRAAEEPEAPLKRPEARPAQPGEAGPPSTPMILRRGPAPAEEPSSTEGPTRAETPSTGIRRPAAGPAAAAAPMGKGFLSVNIYKLPENVRSLPDYSALHPVQTTTTDRINLDPARAQNEPSGLPDNTDGLGLRFMGMFLVSGEGIFRWTVQSKDGVRLHLDDKTLVENDGLHDPSVKSGFIHLAEGVHTIVVDSFNSKGPPLLKVFVTPPVGQEQLFSSKNGLVGWKDPSKPYDVLWGQVYFVPKGNYPQGPDFNRITPIGRLIAPELSIAGGEGFPGLPGRKDMVGIRYEGFFNVQGAGIFAFRLLADHFARLTIGQHVISEITRGSRVDPQGKIGWAFLQQGSYPIRLDFFHPEGPPKLGLYVTQPEKTEEIFSPARPLEGYSAEEGKVSLIPAFVYFIDPNTKKMPNYNKLSPAGMFFTKSIDYAPNRGSREFPGVPKREDWLGIRFYVKFSLGAEEAGRYTFRVVCDDAATLIIDKNRVINAEGIGRTLDQSGSVGLEAGSHEMFLDYFQTTGPNGIQLYITPPGGEEKIFAFN